SSLMRSFDKKRYAALVFAQSWQASGMLSPTAAPICSSKMPNLLPRRRSSNSQPAISCSIQLFAWAAERPRALSRPSLHIIKAPLRRDSGAQEGITNDSSDSRIRKIASAERRGEMWVIESGRTPPMTFDVAPELVALALRAQDLLSTCCLEL